MLFPETLKNHHTSKLMQSVQASLKDNHRQGAFCKLKETKSVPCAATPRDVMEHTRNLKYCKSVERLYGIPLTTSIHSPAINDTFSSYTVLKLDPLLKKAISLEMTGKRLR